MADLENKDTYTMEEIKNMSTKEINDNWEKVQISLNQKGSSADE